jgi:hypothetical protein
MDAGDYAGPPTLSALGDFEDAKSARLRQARVAEDGQDYATANDCYEAAAIRRRRGKADDVSRRCTPRPSPANEEATTWARSTCSVLLWIITTRRRWR